MRLNPDCVRDVLLKIELLAGFRDGILCDTDSYELASEMPDYSRDIILYTLKALLDDGMLDAEDRDMIASHDFIVKDITPKGRDFLDAIRPKSAWAKIKERLGALASISMDILTKIATTYISSKLG